MCVSFCSTPSPKKMHHPAKRVTGVDFLKARCIKWQTQNHTPSHTNVCKSFNKFFVLQSVARNQVQCQRFHHHFSNGLIPCDSFHLSKSSFPSPAAIRKQLASPRDPDFATPGTLKSKVNLVEIGGNLKCLPRKASHKRQISIILANEKGISNFKQSLKWHLSRSVRPPP